MRTTKRESISALKTITRKTKTILAAAFVAVLALTAIRAADITPAETKAIAEAGYIFGLPIVMNYGVMYQSAVDDPGSSRRRSTRSRTKPACSLTGHGHRLAEQRYPVFSRLGGSSGGTDCPVGPRRGKVTLLFRRCSATATPTITDISDAGTGNRGR